MDYEAGTLFVRENRSRADTRTIRVGFVRFRGEGTGAAPTQFMLPGGPGWSMIDYYLLTDDTARRTRFYREIARHRRVSDLVIMDQRGFTSRGDRIRSRLGTRLRRPGEVITAEARINAFRELARAMVDEFEDSEFDLSAYTVQECAADVEDLRRALGCGKITLVGTSFGSQWSLAVMRLFPDSVARALLSGVEPLDHTLDMPAQVFAALQRMWLEVERDPRFQPYLPAGGIAEAAKVVRRRLDAGPIGLGATGSEEPEPRLGITDFHLRDPAMILEAYHGHYDNWRANVTARQPIVRANGNLIAPLIDSALGATPERRHQLRSDPAVRFLGTFGFERYLRTADIWPTNDVGDDFRRPQITSIPVVFAQGDWDLSTPVENTLELARYFPNGRVLVAERGGHGVLGPIGDQLPDVWRSLEQFLRTGDHSAVPARVRLVPNRRFEPPTFEIGNGK